jgi:hypothetical protein
MNKSTHVLEMGRRKGRAETYEHVSERQAKVVPVDTAEARQMEVLGGSIQRKANVLAYHSRAWLASGLPIGARAAAELLVRREHAVAELLGGRGERWAALRAGSRRPGAARAGRWDPELRVEFPARKAGVEAVEEI